MPKTKNILITGATGFVGSHLIEFLLKKEHVVIWGARRRRSDMSAVAHLMQRCRWVELDVADTYSVQNAIKKIQPDLIFHLAAQSFVPTSWNAPQETFITNALGTVNLLEMVRQSGLDTRILIAGTSEEYGLVQPHEVPITENNPLRPLSPYAVSKVAADLTGQQYHRSYGMKTVISRAFNHTGPRRGEMFVTSNFAKQIAEIELGLREPQISVGNLETKRDFSDVRDIVRAYWLALEKGEFGQTYNICSGSAISIHELLQEYLQLATVQNIKVQRDPTRLRPSDVPLLLGDCTKFVDQTGWSPTIPLKKTMNDLLDYWREDLASREADKP